MNPVTRTEKQPLQTVDTDGYSIRFDEESGTREAADPRDFEKIAIFGSSPIMRMVARVVLTVTGVSTLTRFFTTRDEALDWIMRG